MDEYTQTEDLQKRFDDVFFGPYKGSEDMMQFCNEFMSRVTRLENKLEASSCPHCRHAIPSRMQDELKGYLLIKKSTLDKSALQQLMTLTGMSWNVKTVTPVLRGNFEHYHRRRDDERRRDDDRQEGNHKSTPQPWRRRYEHANQAEENKEHDKDEAAAATEAPKHEIADGLSEISLGSISASDLAEALAATAEKDKSVYAKARQTLDQARRERGFTRPTVSFQNFKFLFEAQTRNCKSR